MSEQSKFEEWYAEFHNCFRGHGEETQSIAKEAYDKANVSAANETDSLRSALAASQEREARYRSLLERYEQAPFKLGVAPDWQEVHDALALSTPSDAGRGVTDTQRLDWLEKQLYPGSLYELNHFQYPSQLEGDPATNPDPQKPFYAGSMWDENSGSSLREAIDAAMATHQPPPASGEEKGGRDE